MTKEKLYNIIAKALEKGENDYRNDKCEYNEIIDRAAEYASKKIDRTKYDFVMHVYWHEYIHDDSDTLSENMDYMLGDCLNKKIVCFSVNVSDFDEGYTVATFLTEKQDNNNQKD